MKHVILGVVIVSMAVVLTGCCCGTAKCARPATAETAPVAPVAPAVPEAPAAK